MRTSSFILLAAALLAIPACAGGTTGDTDSNDMTGGKGDGPGSAAVPVTELELEDFIAHGEDRIAEVFGAAAAGAPTSIWFQDGAGSTDLEPIFDHARLVLIADVADSAVPQPGVDLAYWVGLDGTDSVALVRRFADPAPSVQFLNADGFATLTDEALGTPAVDTLLAELRAAHPSATLTYLPSVGVLTFSAPELSDFVALYRRVATSPLVLGLEIGSELYRVPFEFAPAIAVESRTDRFDVAAATTVTKRLREDGALFATTPSLPPPFGPGPISGEQSWQRVHLAVVADGSDPAACAAEADALEGVRLGMVLPVTGIFSFQATAAAAAPVAELACVASVELE